MSDTTQVLVELERVKGTIGEVVVRQQTHEKSDDERYNQIRDNGSLTLKIMTDLSDKLQKGFERVHERVDDEASKARHNLNNVDAMIQTRINMMEKDISSSIANQEKNVSTIQITGLVFLVVTLLSIVAFFMTGGTITTGATQ